MMLEELCRELNNWFDTNPNDGSKSHYFGNFVIEDGSIDLSETDIQPNQYFRIIGSVFNDGVYQYPVTGLTDETFDGTVWTMRIPPSVIDLVSEIDEWQTKYGGLDSPAMSPYNSESFGGYSYTKSVSGSTNGESSLSGTWQGAFYDRLNKWRKIR